METSFRLDCAKVLDTIEILRLRIIERFPRSSLGQVCGDLYEVAKDADATAKNIARPKLWLRFLVGFFVALILGGVVYELSSVDMQGDSWSLADVIQITEAGVNVVVLLGAAIIFLISIETRSKRKRVVSAVNELRAIAHVIDAHQLNKDPKSSAAVDTEHSPQRTLTPYELGRYLDYCSEMLSLVSKVSFLYVQDFKDPVSINSVNEIENLTTGLSRKIWQKIMILRTTSDI